MSAPQLAPTSNILYAQACLKSAWFRHSDTLQPTQPPLHPDAKLANISAQACENQGWTFWSINSENVPFFEVLLYLDFEVSII